jgi:hypothetical protein
MMRRRLFPSALAVAILVATRVGRKAGVGKRQMLGGQRHATARGSPGPEVARAASQAAASAHSLLPGGELVVPNLSYPRLRLLTLEP